VGVHVTFAMTCWLSQTDAALAQGERRASWDTPSGFAASLAIGHNANARDLPVGVKELCEFFFRGRKGEIPDKDIHGALLPCSRRSLRP
jgi:hypothetical protein